MYDMDLKHLALLMLLSMRMDLVPAVGSASTDGTSTLRWYDKVQSK